MAENKKSFVLYADLIHTVKKLPIGKAGELFVTILKYVNDENPIIEDLAVDLVFEPIKRQLKRDLIRWDSIKVSRAESGRLGGLAKAKNANQIIPNLSATDTVISNEKLAMIDAYFRDYPNSSYIERVSMELKIPLLKLQEKLNEFKTTSSSEYQNMSKFSDHFKRWVKKQNDEGKIDISNESAKITLGKKK